MDTVAHAQTIRNAVQAELAGKDLFENHNLNAFVDEEGQVHATFDFSFNSRVDRDTITTWIKDQVSTHPTVKDWVLSAKVVTHLCSHWDEVVRPCTETEYVVWEK